MNNRRRFLQILAAAPFAPWQEIAEELAKPIRTYSIPEARREIQALELETFNKPVPNLMGITVAGRSNFIVGDEIVLHRGSGQCYGKFKISRVEGSGIEVVSASREASKTLFDRYMLGK